MNDARGAPDRTPYSTGRAYSDQRLPEIKPVIIEGPPLVLPPNSLGHLHFNDRLIYFIQAKR